MARTKKTNTSTNTSASKNKKETEIKVAKISEPVGKSKASVSEIKEQYALDQKRQEANFAKANEDKILRVIKNLSKGNTSINALNAVNKEKIKAWLTGNIYSNSQNLIQASRYLYYRSSIYSKMIHAYVGMYCLDCRKLTPNYNFNKEMDTQKTLKQYEETANFLDILSIQNNAYAPLVNMFIEDVSFNLFFHDDTGSMFWHIDPSEAIIDGIYTVDGGSCYSMALNMSLWKSTQKQELIEFLGEPLISMYKEYERTGIKYVHVPAEYSFVIKFRTDLINAIIPPLIFYLPQLGNLLDLQDSQSTADAISLYKLIYLPLQTLSNARNSDEWSISPDLAIEYFKIAADTAIPDGVSSAVIPGEELKTIDFSDNVSEDVNRVENSQQQILGAAGGVGALLNANKAVNNTALINAALKSESHYILNPVLPQLEAWTNMQLALNLSDHCHISYMPVTIFTKDEYRKNLLEANTYGFMYRLAYGTLLGFTEKQTMAQLKFENDILGLQNQMIYPLQSSYTLSGNSGTGEVGRPEVDATELSPSGERSRNQ